MIGVIGLQSADVTSHYRGMGYVTAGNTRSARKQKFRVNAWRNHTGVGQTLCCRPQHRADVAGLPFPHNPHPS